MKYNYVKIMSIITKVQYIFIDTNLNLILIQNMY